jgi:hypothetical protein
MAQGETLRVKGLRELVRATSKAEKESRTEVRKTLKKVGEVVRVPWSQELDRFGARTATGLRTVVRQRGVSVEQTRRKTTGTRPDFGFRQQLLGEDVLAEQQDEVEHEMEDAVDTIADHFERR